MNHGSSKVVERLIDSCAVRSNVVRVFCVCSNPIYDVVVSPSAWLYRTITEYPSQGVDVDAVPIILRKARYSFLGSLSVFPPLPF